MLERKTHRKREERAREREEDIHFGGKNWECAKLKEAGNIKQIEGNELAHHNHKFNSIEIQLTKEKALIQSGVKDM